MVPAADTGAVVPAAGWVEGDGRCPRGHLEGVLMPARVSVGSCVGSVLPWFELTGFTSSEVLGRSG